MLDGEKKQALLVERLAQTHPGLAFSQPCTLRGGTEADVLVFRDSVVRFLRAPDIKQLATEKIFSDALAGHGGFNIPEVTFTSEDGSFNIQKRLAGLPIVPEGGTEEGVKISQLSRQDIAQLGRGIAAFAATLHEASRRGEVDAGPLGSRIFHDPTAKGALEEFLALCTDEKLKGALSKLRDVEEDRREVHVHGDLWYGNVFFDSCNKSAPVSVLDFGRSGMGPPASEFAQISSIWPAVYRETVRHYNEMSAEKLDPLQPVLHMVAIYAHAYVHCGDEPEKNPGDHDRQKAHALWRLGQVAEEYLGYKPPATPAPSPLPK
jgi:aminoglycoside phosphotransferase (APT) family kinase protein